MSIFDNDFFSSPAESVSRFGDKVTTLDEDTSFGGIGGVTGIKNAQEWNEGFGNWYEGPGGESATKLGLALIAMFGPGAALMSGLGGEGGLTGSGGGDTGGSGSGIQQGIKGLSGLTGGGNNGNGNGGGGSGLKPLPDKFGSLLSAAKYEPQHTPLFNTGVGVLSPENLALYRMATGR